MNLFFKNLLEKLHLTYKYKSIFTKFYWTTWWDRKTRGFDITDTWNLDYTFAKFMVPRLLAYLSCIAKDNTAPGVIYQEMTAEYRQKGHKYDEKTYKFLNPKINDEVLQKSADRWFKIVQTITDGLQDFLLEENNYNEWEYEWTKTLEELKFKLRKCKSKIKKIKVLNQYNISYSSYEENTLDIYFLSNTLRRKGMQLFGKYFYNLWW